MGRMGRLGRFFLLEAVHMADILGSEATFAVPSR